MGSSNVKAQQLANEANVQMTRETNQTNRDIAAEANKLNYQMFNEQNQWNLDQWNRENEYNSPSAQMQRYIQAGINPLWALGNGDPGNAQQLTSAGSPPAEVAKMQAPQVMPEADPTKLSNIVAATNNLSNSLQGFVKLGLEEQDVSTRRQAMQNQAAVQSAEALFKKSQTAGQEIFNNLNTRTFETQVSTKVSELNRLNSEIANAQKQGSLLDAELRNKNATYDQIKAMTHYTSVQADALLDQVKQGWKRLAIDQQNADTSSFVAGSNSYYQGENLKLEGQKFYHSVEQFKASLAQQTNDQILSWCNNRVGYLQKIIGSNPLGSKSNNILGTFEIPPDQMLDVIQKAGTELQNRFVSNPSDSNLQSYQEYLNTINRIPQAPSALPSQTLQGFSVLNPSGY